jgi:hypothetical protein
MTEFFRGGHCATSRQIAGSIPNEVTGFFTSPNPSSHIIALGSTQSLRDINTRNLAGGKGRPARKPEKLTAICELIV